MMLINDAVNNYPGVFSLPHILYSFFSVVLIAVGCILVRKKVKQEKTKVMIIKSSGLFLLVNILVNRITVTYYNIYINSLDGYTWLNVIPNTLCATVSLALALSVLFGKKDSILFHGLCYFGLTGGISNLIYPNYLDTQMFFDPRTITGLVHHTLMIWITILMIVCGYFKPTLKKWYASFIALCFIMTLGIFELDCLGFDQAMQIGNPLISGAVITSWYVVNGATILGEIIVLAIIEIIKKHKSEKSNECNFIDVG